MAVLGWLSSWRFLMGVGIGAECEFARWLLNEPTANPVSTIPFPQSLHQSKSATLLMEDILLTYSIDGPRPKLEQE